MENKEKKKTFLPHDLVVKIAMGVLYTSVAAGTVGGAFAGFEYANNHNSDASVQSRYEENMGNALADYESILTMQQEVGGTLRDDINIETAKQQYAQHISEEQMAAAQTKIHPAATTAVGVMGGGVAGILAGCCASVGTFELLKKLIKFKEARRKRNEKNEQTM